jgi:hypothetical protein
MASPASNHPPALPAPLLQVATEVLGRAAAERDAALHALAIEHPEHAEALRRLAADFAATERLLATSFPAADELPAQLGPFRCLTTAIAVMTNRSRAPCESQPLPIRPPWPARACEDVPASLQASEWSRGPSAPLARTRTTSSRPSSHGRRAACGLRRARCGPGSTSPCAPVSIPAACVSTELLAGEVAPRM